MRSALLAIALATTAWSQPLTTAELEAIPLVPPRQGKSIKKELFDGKSLKGWQGNLDWWSVDKANGALRGKHNDKVPTNFLYTKENFSDFRLTLQSKMVESENHAGVAFWGSIATKGDNKWYTQGPLVVFPRPGMWDYIEAKGLRVLKLTTKPVTEQHEWVKVEILAQGNRVRTALNGVEVMDWREANPARLNPGPIGLQLHAWPSAQEVLYRNIVIETFPPITSLTTVP